MICEIVFEKSIYACLMDPYTEFFVMKTIIFCNKIILHPISFIHNFFVFVLNTL